MAMDTAGKKLKQDDSPVPVFKVGDKVRTPSGVVGVVLAYDSAPTLTVGAFVTVKLPVVSQPETMKLGDTALFGARSLVKV